jgi:hypothetical protein
MTQCATSRPTVTSLQPASLVVDHGHCNYGFSRCWRVPYLPSSRHARSCAALVGYEAHCGVVEVGEHSLRCRPDQRWQFRELETGDGRLIGSGASHGLAGWHSWQATWRLWLGASSAACPRRSGLGCELRKSCLPCRARGAQQSQFAAASRICHGDDAILGVLSRRLQVPRERPPSAVGSQKDPDDPSNGFRDAYWTRGCGALSPSRLAGRAGRHQIPRILPDHGPTI